MSYTANVTTGTGTATVTVSTGGRGPAGATGPAGAAGTSLTAGTGIDITEGVVSSTVTGNATHTGDATGSTALTLATVNGNIGSFTNASLTVNGKGLVTAASSGTAPITSVTGTANQITVASFSTGRTLSLASPINVNTTGNAATVTTNANLTGHITSVGNAASLGSFTLAQLDTATSDATLARTDAGQTFSGEQTFAGQIASSGSTDATASTNVVNVATNDARYGGVVTRATALADVTALTTANVSGPAATLAAGTYEYDICQVYETISEVMGVSGGVTLSGNLDTMHSGVLTKATSVTGNGSSVTSATTVRTGSSTLQYAAGCNADAPANYAACVAKGMFTLSGSVTLTMVVATRTASGAATAMVNGSSYTIVAAGTTDFTLVGSANNTPGTTFTKSGSAATGTGTVSDNTNPARLKAGSFMKFTKIA